MSDTPDDTDPLAAENVVPFVADDGKDEPLGNAGTTVPAAGAEKASRRGKATKSKKGEAATFVPGGAQGPRAFDPERIASELHLWWEDGDGQTFFVGSNPKTVPVKPSGDGCDALFEEMPQVWSRWPEKKIVNLLRTKYVRMKAREGETLSEMERLLIHVMQNRRLDMAINCLAGYPAGIHDVGGQRVLVRTGPRLLEPKEGDWSLVEKILRSKLDFSYGDEEGHGVDQTPFFHGWMKTALESLYQGGPGNFRPGQCCIFAGPRDSAKSRIQHQIISGMLGQRSADPGPYLFGRTDFNGEMFSAEHLMMEDPASSTKTVDRVFFGEMLKQLVVNDTQRLHRKREDAIVVSPFFRTTISINDDPDKMRVLPLLTPDMKDKVHLFLVNPHPLPMPTSSTAERAAFRAKIMEQLPAYAWWLMHTFEIKESMRSVRFGVREWHHPTLAMELFDDTPGAELLQIIDAATFTAGEKKGDSDTKLWDIISHANPEEKKWEGTAIDLERLLLGTNGEWRCSLDNEAKKFCAHNKVDRVLSRLKEDQPERVVHRRTRHERRWIVIAPE